MSLVNCSETDILSLKSIQLSAVFSHKNDAIYAAVKLLMGSDVIKQHHLGGIIGSKLITNVASIWFRSGVAVIYGITESYQLVMRDAVSVVQIPAGVEWQDERRVYLVIAVITCADLHIKILKKIAPILFDEQKLKELSVIEDKQKIITALLGRSIGEKVDLVSDLSVAKKWVLDYPNGLHARPASIWVNFAKKNQSPIRVRYGGCVVEMKDFVGLLQLRVTKGSVLVFSTDASGGEALLKDVISVAEKVSMSEKSYGEKNASSN